jgi:hypothetical protein
LPEPSTATPYGKKRKTLVAAPLKLQAEEPPPPANVEIVPPEVTLRIRPLLVSAM